MKFFCHPCQWFRVCNTRKPQNETCFCYENINLCTSVVEHLHVLEFWRNTLTIYCNSDILLFGFFTAGDSAFIEATVWSVELWNGQNTVEQYVCSVFQEPLGSGASVVTLKIKEEKSQKINTESSPVCSWNLFWKAVNVRVGIPKPQCGILWLNFWHQNENNWRNKALTQQQQVF